MIAWLDRLLARLLPVRTRNGGDHARVKGDVFDHDPDQTYRIAYEDLPCHQPDPRWALMAPAAVPLEPLPDGVLTYISDKPMTAALAERLTNLPVPAVALGSPGKEIPRLGRRDGEPDTPNLDQGNWHPQALADTSFDLPRYVLRFLFVPIETIGDELERDRQRVPARAA